MYEEVKLQDLVGEHMLSGVDMGTSKYDRYGDGNDICDTNDIRFILDEDVYVAKEDPGDGYRSCMENIVKDSQVAVKNMFTPQWVFCHMGDAGNGENEVLTMRDMATGKVVLMVGTDTSDSYYPCFISEFTPENMAINADK